MRAMKPTQLPSRARLWAKIPTSCPASGKTVRQVFALRLQFLRQPVKDQIEVQFTDHRNIKPVASSSSRTSHGCRIKDNPGPRVKRKNAAHPAILCMNLKVREASEKQMADSSRVLLEAVQSNRKGARSGICSICSPIAMSWRLPCSRRTAGRCASSQPQTRSTSSALQRLVAREFAGFVRELPWIPASRRSGSSWVATTSGLPMAGRARRVGHGQGPASWSGAACRPDTPRYISTPACAARTIPGRACASG